MTVCGLTATAADHAAWWKPGTDLVGRKATPTPDAAGNRTGRTQDGAVTTWTYDAADRLTGQQRAGDAANQVATAQQGAAVTTFTHDAAGNLAVENAGGALTTHTWDGENRLTAVAFPDGTASTYTYAPDGLRRSAQEGGGALTTFVWDGDDYVQERTAGGVVRYVTVGGEVVAEKRDGERRLHVPDPLGSTVALVNAAGAVTDTFRHWPYGEEAARTGSTPTPFRYVGTAGYYRDRLASIYVRKRHYRPDLARWLSADPLGWVGDCMLGLYVYADDSPTVALDVTGLYKIDKADKTRCGKGSIIITPGGGDETSIVVGPGGTLIDGEKVFGLLGGGDHSGCIAVNGGFFAGKPYNSGRRCDPSGPVVDCRGKPYPGAPNPPPKLIFLPVITDRGRVCGRPPDTRIDGNVPEGRTPRTGACVSAGGRLIAIVVVPRPGLTIPGQKRCLDKACPKGSTPVNLDGGGSTQVVRGGNPPSRYPGFRPRRPRPVHNWIVICPPSRSASLL